MEKEREMLTPEEIAIRKKRAARKRKMRLAFVIFVFALLIGIVVGGITSLFVFRVKGFTVESESATYQHQEIIDASEIELNKSLIFINLDKAEDSVERKLPFLKNVEITKKLPNNLIIRFEEAGMAYAVEIASNTYAITNDEFKVLSISGEIAEGVIPVKGQIPVKTEIGETIAFVEQTDKDEEIEDTVLNLLKDIASTLSENEMSGVTVINTSSLNDIYLIYQDRILVEFGDTQNIKAKASLFVRAIEKEDAINSTRTGIMDITIAQSAYIYPSDVRDIPELAEHLGINSEASEDENKENSGEEEQTEEEKDEEETTASEE